MSIFMQLVREKVGKGLYRPPLGPRPTIGDLFDISINGEYLSWEDKAFKAKGPLNPNLAASTLRNWESGRQVPKLNSLQLEELLEFLDVDLYQWNAAVKETLKRNGGKAYDKWYRD
jgi:hypothetical protein